MLTALIPASFEREVRQGLLKTPKALPAKFFYDRRGSEIFERITRLPEYYLTRSETEILTRYGLRIFEHIQTAQRGGQIVELGAGSAAKISLLLQAAASRKERWTYVPVDVCQTALQGIQTQLAAKFPDVSVSPYHGDYLQRSWRSTSTSKLVLFLGANIGNYSPDHARRILTKLASSFGSNTYLLIGFDLHKPSSIILPAYNDAQGVTAEFNLNLLRRINYECEANFDLTQFCHAPIYNETLRRAESYLVSTQTQTVVFNRTYTRFQFAPGERIFTEISQKYTLPDCRLLLENSGFEVIDAYFDSPKYYVDILCRVHN